MQPLQYIETGGTRIAYRREGSGEPLLLIHGITTYSFIWEKMIPFLSGFDVVALDLMGCGDSAKPSNRDYSIAAQADIVLSLMETLGFERVHLAGHDIGGGIVQIVTVKKPEKVLSLTLINSIGYDYWPVQPILTMKVPILKHIALALFDLGMFRLLVRRGFHNRELVTDEMMNQFFAPLQSPEGKQGFLQLAKSLDHRHLMEIADRIPLIEQPALIIRGESDLYLKGNISERLHRNLKNSRYEKFSESGHFLTLEEPERAAALIREVARIKEFRAGS